MVATVLALGVLCGAPALAATGNPLSVSPVNAVEGQTFDGVVGTIASCAVGSYSATINWGDGSSVDAGTVTSESNGVCTIGGTHTYSENGQDTLTVTATPTAGGSPDTGTTTATIADAPLSVSANAIAGTAGDTFSGVVATLTDYGGLRPGAYTANVNWGDGSTSAATVDASGGVSASHVYANAGSFAFIVTVSDEGGSTAMGNATATIAVPSVALPSPSSPTCSSTAASSPAPFPSTSGKPDERYVQALYKDLLDAGPSPSEVSYFTSQLALGVTRAQVASELLASPAYAAVLVGSFYERYLGQAPEPAATSFFASELGDGATDESVQAQILGSTEYFDDRADGTNAGWVAAANCDLLDDSADANDLSFWGGELASDLTRAQVATGILTSSGYRTLLIDSLYERFLRRAANPSAIGYWLAAGLTDEQLIAALVSSQEYASQLGPAAGTLSTPTISDHGIIHLVLHRRATLELDVSRVLAGTGIKTIALPAAVKRRAIRPKLRHVAIVNLGHYRAGRITIHWGYRAHGHFLKPGRYTVRLLALGGKTVIDATDALTVTVPRNRH